VINNLRAAVAANGKKICGIMLDTKGPEIRTGKLADKKEVDLVAGQSIKVSSDPTTIVCKRTRPLVTIINFIIGKCWFDISRLCWISRLCESGGTYSCS
jgi:pyruvate kinase